VTTMLWPASSFETRPSGAPQDEENKSLMVRRPRSGRLEP
jgi:hypothetical protein